MSNTFGHLFRLTSFGESHGPAIGGIIDGVPADCPIDLNALQTYVARRRPGQSQLTTTRKEADHVEILSGIFEGRTLGTPIGFIIRNNDAHPDDYRHLRNLYRPGHGDFTYQAKYHIRDHRGGGRASARETATRMVAGAIATQILNRLKIHITAYTSQIGTIALNKNHTQLDLSQTDLSPTRCPDPDTASRMAQAINQARLDGDTLGGTVACVITGVPAGIGAPVFAKLHADLAAAMLSINAARAFELGPGTQFASLSGSQALQLPSTGIVAGISDGTDITFRVTFKPIATLNRTVTMTDSEGQHVDVPPSGRHDITAVPRAVPIVEAMAAITLLDHYLLNQTTHIR